MAYRSLSQNAFIMVLPMVFQVLQRPNKAKERHLFGFEKSSLCRSLCFMDDFSNRASDPDRAKGVGSGLCTNDV